MWKDIKLTLYDFFGYLLPGCVGGWRTLSLIFFPSPQLRLPHPARGSQGAHHEPQSHFFSGLRTFISARRSSFTKTAPASS